MPVLHFRGNERWPHGSPVLRSYVGDDEHDVNLCEGPVESGKTAASIARAYRLMCEMPRGLDGVRRSRGLIVRPTYGELLETVVTDWLEWFPEEVYGEFKRTEPYKHKMRFLDVECDVVFMALCDDKPETLRKLRSTFFTWAWVNEGQYCPLRLFTEIIDRTGRYPRKVDCPSYDRRKRAWLDNNAAPQHRHWIRVMRGDVGLPHDMPADERLALQKPDNWRFWRQPPAVLEDKDERGNVTGYRLNPKAENLQNMGDDPYLPALSGKARDQIDRDFRNVSRPMRGGAPRYPGFDRTWHVADTVLEPYEGAEIILGFDWGLTPACTFEQVVDGQWRCYHELVFTNAGAEEMAPEVLRVLGRRFPWYRQAGLSAWGDPAGAWRQGSVSAAASHTSFAVMKAHGIQVRAPFERDDPELRLATGRQLLKDTVNRAPRVLICPEHCPRLIEAMDGGARMKQVRIEGTEHVVEQLVKNASSHVIEAWEYPKIGYGEGRALVAVPGARNRAKPVDTRGKGSVFSWRKAG